MRMLVPCDNRCQEASSVGYWCFSEARQYFQTIAEAKSRGGRSDYRFFDKRRLIHDYFNGQGLMVAKEQMEQDQEKARLFEKRDELRERLEAIKRDYRKGLDADAEERAIQLENAEVLDAIARATEEELQRIEKRLSDLA